MTTKRRDLPVPTAIANHYRSVDSAPPKYAVDRPASASNGFLIVFTALSIISLTTLTALVSAGVLDQNDPVLLAGDRGNVLMPTRLFVAVFFVTYAAHVYSNRWRRVFLGCSLLGKFAVVCAVVDVGGWALYELNLLTVPIFAQQVISGLLALAVFPHTIMRQAHLPPARRGRRTPRTPASAYVTMLLCLITAMLIAALIEQVFFRAVVDLRQWALLGGMGPGVFLVQQLFAAFTAIFGWRALNRSRRSIYTPPLAVLVPAHDEAHDIAATIAAVERSAIGYPARIHLYIVDNASTDATVEMAAQALGECTVITGEVIECRTPGKAIALNMGLEHITEDFVVRIDADTVIAPGCLQTALRHFADPTVGSVGGLPLPATQVNWIDRVRLVEVLLRHGFFQVSLFGYRGVLGVPGMFSVYRRDVLLEVGGIVEGMNGEDTDICLRMDFAGYHTVSDPKAVYYSETPTSYAHLREQRIRWFRSIYHIAAHNGTPIFDRRSITGTFVLPFQLVNAARRAMLAPILIYALLVELIFRPVAGDIRWQPIVATVLGMQMIVALLVCLFWWKRTIRYIPAYLAFRVLRSYFTIGAALSLVYPPLQPGWKDLRRSTGASTSSPSGEAKSR
ncbi:glycosyltransferase [Dietzia sp. NPDC055877]